MCSKNLSVRYNLNKVRIPEKAVVSNGGSLWRQLVIEILVETLGTPSYSHAKHYAL